MPIDEVVADANVLLSAVVGKAALRVLTNFGVTVHVAEFNANEVLHYLPFMADKYHLPKDQILLQWKLLPLKIHKEKEYKKFLPEALRELADRDPEDAHALALARYLGLPLWSNDKDLKNLEVACYPTAKLLKILTS